MIFVLARLAVEIAGLVVAIAVAKAHFGWDQSDVNWFLFAYCAWDISKGVSQSLREMQAVVEKEATECRRSSPT